MSNSTSSKYKSEYSAGGVVFRRDSDGYKIAVVARARHTDWSLPKGHLEPGETREEAAIREVKEETGLDVQIRGELGEVIYFYRRPKGALIRKSVFHYLMETTGEKVGGPNWEVSEVRLVPIAGAADLLTYEKDKEIVAKAIDILEMGVA